MATKTKKADATKKEEPQIVKGYKVTNSDGSCRGFMYEVGKEYIHKGAIGLCSSGFHFCRVANDCFNYYSFNPDNRLFEIEATGDVVDGDDKSVCSRLKIIRELTWQEVLNTINTGKGNTGRANTGYRNSGYLNSGYRNSGDLNSGDRNSGYRNSGDLNSGDLNSGDLNSGDLNSGDLNSGDRNSGYLNNGDHNSGVFCTGTPQMMLFNKPCDMTMKEFLNSKPYKLASNIETTIWVGDSMMTDKEKEDNPTYATTEGYLKVIPFKEAFKNAWHNWDANSRKSFTALPNFDPAIFLEITGIDINETTK